MAERLLGLKLAAVAGLVFLHLPVSVIVLYAFTTKDRTYAFPASGLTLHWFEAAFARDESGRRCACRSWWRLATLGGARSSARSRPSHWRAATFPRQESITLLFVLPIALPGIITGLALLPAIKSVGLTPGFWTIVAGHTTFCLVIVHNNVIARLRRIPPSWSRPRWTWAPTAGRPSALCCSRRSRQRCSRADAGVRIVLRRDHRHAVHGRARAHAAIWFYNELFRPRERPITNVVAVIVILVTLDPILLALPDHGRRHVRHRTRTTEDAFMHTKLLINGKLVPAQAKEDVLEPGHGQVTGQGGGGIRRTDECCGGGSRCAFAAWAARRPRIARRCCSSLRTASRRTARLREARVAELRQALHRGARR